MRLDAAMKDGFCVSHRGDRGAVHQTDNQGPSRGARRGCGHGAGTDPGVLEGRRRTFAGGPASRKHCKIKGSYKIQKTKI